MSDIAISPTQFFIIGIPQGFLFVLATYIFTNTKFNFKKYIFISSIVTVLTYLIRFLPITIGVNTMLSLLVLIMAFLIVYKFDLPKIAELIVSVIVIFFIIGVSELFNELILNFAFGKAKSQALLNSSSSVIKSVSLIPSNIIFAVIVLIVYLILSNKRNKKDENGKAGKKPDN